MWDFILYGLLAVATFLALVAGPRIQDWMREKTSRLFAPKSQFLVKGYVQYANEAQEAITRIIHARSPSDAVVQMIRRLAVNHVLWGPKLWGPPQKLVLNASRWAAAPEPSRGVLPADLNGNISRLAFWTRAIPVPVAPADQSQPAPAAAAPGDNPGDNPASHLFRNHYRCPACAHDWIDEWDSTCDDDCPACGCRHISPYASDDLQPQADRELQQALNTNLRRYIAHFDNQMWVHEHALSVDPRGPAEWDCTSFVVGRPGFEELSNLEPGAVFIDREDALRDDVMAPAWVKTWDGPFTISVRLADGPVAGQTVGTTPVSPVGQIENGAS